MKSKKQKEEMLETKAIKQAIAQAMVEAAKVMMLALSGNPTQLQTKTFE